MVPPTPARPAGFEPQLSPLSWVALEKSKSFHEPQFLYSVNTVVEPKKSGLSALPGSMCVLCKCLLFQGLLPQLPALSPHCRQHHLLFLTPALAPLLLAITWPSPGLDTQAHTLPSAITALPALPCDPPLPNIHARVHVCKSVHTHSPDPCSPAGHLWDGGKGLHLPCPAGQSLATLAIEHLTGDQCDRENECSVQTVACD